MMIVKYCKTCKGTGKLGNNICPDCEYKDLMTKAEAMRLDVFYFFTPDRMPEMLRMATVLKNPLPGLHNWHIIVYENNTIRRVDWTWMNPPPAGR